MNYKKLSLIVLFVSICLLVGCKSGRAGVNQTRLYNNKDDVKIDSVNKIISIDDRDYFAIYVYLKNNTDSDLKDVKFNFELKNKDGVTILDNGSFEVDKIPAKKRALADCVVDINEDCDVNKLYSITFSSFAHDGSNGRVDCSKEITLYKKNIRIEEMETR